MTRRPRLTHEGAFLSISWLARPAKSPCPQPSSAEGAPADAARNSQMKEIRNLDSECFLGELQGVRDDDVMEDGEQVWWSKGAGIWGWPWCWLERFGDLRGYIPVLRPQAEGYFVLLLL